jgi:hypothetical protein
MAPEAPPRPRRDTGSAPPAPVLHPATGTVPDWPPWMTCVGPVDPRPRKDGR